MLKEISRNMRFVRKKKCGGKFCQPMVITETPFERINLDIVEIPPKKILTIRDELAKFP